MALTTGAHTADEIFNPNSQQFEANSFQQANEGQIGHNIFIIKPLMCYPPAGFLNTCYLTTQFGFLNPKYHTENYPAITGYKIEIGHYLAAVVNSSTVLDAGLYYIIQCTVKVPDDLLAHIVHPVTFVGVDKYGNKLLNVHLGWFEALLPLLPIVQQQQPHTQVVNEQQRPNALVSYPESVSEHYKPKPASNRNNGSGTQRSKHKREIRRECEPTPTPASKQMVKFSVSGENSKKSATSLTSTEAQSSCASLDLAEIEGDYSNQSSHIMDRTELLVAKSFDEIYSDNELGHQEANQNKRQPQYMNVGLKILILTDGDPFAFGKDYLFTLRLVEEYEIEHERPFKSLIYDESYAYSTGICIPRYNVKFTTVDEMIKAINQLLDFFTSFCNDQESKQKDKQNKENSNSECKKRKRNNFEDDYNLPPRVFNKGKSSSTHTGVIERIIKDFLVKNQNHVTTEPSASISLTNNQEQAKVQKVLPITKRSMSIGTTIGMLNINEAEEQEKEQDEQELTLVLLSDFPILVEAVWKDNDIRKSFANFLQSDHN